MASPILRSEVRKQCYLKEHTLDRGTSGTVLAITHSTLTAYVHSKGSGKPSISAIMISFRLPFT